MGCRLNAVKKRACIENRRSVADRRKLPTQFLSRHAIFGGRRCVVRRQADRKTHILTDNYDTRIFVVLLLVLLLSVSDAYLTLTLVKIHKATELNPLMALYLENGSIIFFLEKFLFTSLAVFIFCVFNRLAVTRFSLALTIIIYSGLVYYEISLLKSVLV